MSAMHTDDTYMHERIHRVLDPTVVADIPERPASQIFPAAAILGSTDIMFATHRQFSLDSKRALACVCYDLRAVMNSLLRGADLTVDAGDANWANARFVASLLPTLQNLHVVGETYLPTLELARYRTLSCLKVGDMGVPAALFFGAAIARCDCRLRLSDNITLRNLAPFRETSHAQIPEGATDSDVAALLGAISLNPELTIDRFRGILLRILRRLVPSMSKASFLSMLRGLTSRDPTGLACSVRCEDHMFATDRELDGASLLRIAAPGLREDPEVVLATMMVYGWDLKLVPEVLRADRRVVYTAVNQNGKALQFADAAIRDDEHVVRAAIVASNGVALKWASEGLRARREVVEEAVELSGHVLEHASEALRADPDIVLQASLSEPSSVQFAADALQANPEFRALCFCRHGSRVGQCTACFHISIGVAKVRAPVS